MVFESLLVDILNRYLKPYVKKIDSSNLNIGVWNGMGDRCFTRQSPLVAFKQRACPLCKAPCLSLVHSTAGNVHLKQLELKEDILVRPLAIMNNNY